MVAKPRTDRTNRSAGSIRSGADRLWHALATLLDSDDGSGRAVRAVTVAHLGRLAGVSRNSLYRYHIDAAAVIKALRKYQRRRGFGDEPNIAGNRDWLRNENALLRKNIAKLAALADHYYLAYQETAALCQRRERELAEIRRSFDARPVPLKH